MKGLSYGETEPPYLPRDATIRKIKKDINNNNNNNNYILLNIVAFHNKNITNSNVHTIRMNPASRVH